MRKSKGKPDLRRIRSSRCYSVLEAAALLGVSTGTVRAWIRLGLPVLEECKPVLIPGDRLKAWLKTRAKARKHHCQPNELYCCRCRSPQKARPGSVEITQRNAKTIAIRALCDSCEAKMNKAGSLARIAEVKAAFGLNTVAQASLAGCETPAVNQHSEKETAE
jgi:hypothetical protein